MTRDELKGLPPENNCQERLKRSKLGAMNESRKIKNNKTRKQQGTF